MILDDFLYNVFVIFVFLFLLVFFHQKLISKYFNLPFGISLSLFVSFFVSAYAIYFTAFSTSLFILFLGIIAVLLINFSSSKKQNIEKEQSVFFLSSFGLHFLIMLLFIFYIQSVTENNLSLNGDFSFYLNKILLIKKSGIESIGDIGIFPFSAPYHFFDLWVLGFFNELPIPFEAILYLFILPFFSSLLSINIVYFNNKKPNFVNFLLSNLSIYIIGFLFPFISFFKDLELLQASIFTYPKLIFIGFLFTIILYFFFQKKYIETIIVSCGIAFSYFSILPAIALFCVGLVTYLLIKKEYKTVGLVIVFAGSSLLFVFLLYKNYIFSSNAIDAGKANVTYIDKFSYFALSIMYLVYFLPYFLLPIINDYKQFFAKRKSIFNNQFFLLILFILGGSFASSYLYRSFVDFYQFYFVTLIPIIAVLVSNFWINYIKKTSIQLIGYSFLLFAFIVFGNKLLYTGFGEKNRENEKLIKDFLLNKEFPQNVAYLVNSKWKDDPYFVNPEFFEPEELFSINKKPIDFYWIGIYKNDLPQKNKYYQQGVLSLSNTEFQRFYQNQNQDLVKAQIKFINSKKSNFLVVDNYKLPVQIRSLFSDSVNLKKKNIVIYYRPIK